MNLPKINRKFIADKAKVSTATVSYVLNNIPSARISDKTRKRVIDTAKKYNYFPNLVARSLAMKKTFNIGFINTKALVEFLSDPFQNAIFAGIESEIEKNGFSLLFSLLKCTTNMEELNFSVRKMICGNIVDGIVLYGKVEPELVEFLYQNKVKFVLVDYFLKDVPTISIMPENTEGAYLAVKHLLDQNIKKVFCINGDTTHPSYLERPEGYFKAMSERNLPTRVLKTDATINNTYSFIKTLIERNDLPEAFFATGDHMAVGILRCLHDHGLKVPEEIKVVGFDDCFHYSTEQEKLTTVHVPQMEMGQEAVRTLLRIIEKEEKPFIKRMATHLVVRGSA